MPDPQQIIDRFEPEFEKLVLALCMLPWGQAVDAADAHDWLFGGTAADELIVRKAARECGRKTDAAGLLRPKCNGKISGCEHLFFGRVNAMRNSITLLLAVFATAMPVMAQKRRRQQRRP